MHLLPIVADSSKNLYFALMSERLVSLLTEGGYLPVSFLLNGHGSLLDALKEAKAIGAKEAITYLEPEERDVSFAKENGIGLFLVGRRSPFPEVRSVYTDDKKGGRLAAEYLLGKKAASYMYIGLDGSECSIRRYEGFREALAKKGKECSAVSAQDFTLSGLRDCLLKGKVGIFVYNDEILFNIALMLRRFNLGKAKVELIGYDGISRDYECIGNYPSICFSYKDISRSVYDMLTGKIPDREIVHDVALYRV